MLDFNMPDTLFLWERICCQRCLAAFYSALPIEINMDTQPSRLVYGRVGKNSCQPKDHVANY